MHNNKKHILVTGSHRSGTTWVGKTISQHPRIKYIREPFNVSYPNHSTELKLNTWFTHYQSSSQKEEIEASFDNLIQSSSLVYAIQRCKVAGLDVKTPLRFGKHLILPRPRFLIKDPIALLSAGWLYERYDLKVVCMIRNPLAVIGSLKKAGWDLNLVNFQKQKELMQGLLIPFIEKVDKLCGHTGDFIDRACLLWNILHYVILKYQKQYPSWLFVKYEDIAVDPVSEFQRIFDYLELNMNNQIREYIEEFTSEMNPKESTSTGYQPRNSKMSLKNWQERLSTDEVERVRNATRNISAQIYEDAF